MKNETERLTPAKRQERNKLFRRSAPIILNGIRSVLTPVIFIVFSFLIVHYHSKTLWGEFVEFLLFFYIASLISNWGSKDYLSRVFSENPGEMVSNWQQHFIVRIPLLLLTMAVVPFIFDSETHLFFIVWLFAGYLNNAFIPLYTYRRDFGKVILTELAGFALLVFLVLTSEEELTITALVYFYALHQLLKTLIYSLIYNSFFRFRKMTIRWSLLLLSFPFMLMAGTGFLQSKIDLYIFGFFNTDVQLGEYQIISGFFIFSQSIATIILLPYLKNIYRMKTVSIMSLKRQMIGTGTLFNIIVVAVIWFALKTFFAIELSPAETLCGFFIGWPSYLYILHIFYLFKHKQEQTVLKICTVSLCFNLILSLVLLSLRVGILGALIANSASQLVALVLYLSKKIDDDVFKKTE